MITKSALTLEHQTRSANDDWQSELAAAIRDPAQLLDILRLPSALLPAARRAAAQFPLRVPHSFVARMQPGDANDPLLRQVLPLADELENRPGYHEDPVGDLDAAVVPGLIHKYHGRALLIATGACGVHCRYCFRRHFPYPVHQPTRLHWPPILDYLRNHTEIDEIILSGGDPLSLSDQRLNDILLQLEAIPHLTSLRIHSRLPVVLPSRMTRGLVQRLQESRFNVIMVLHVNHPNEVNLELANAVTRLRTHRVHCLNQSVLLRGVNDDPDILVQLSKGLFEAGVLPYYLHQFDPVRQAHHFDVTLERGQAIWQALRARLPGYLLPRYVREYPGDCAKTPLVGPEPVNFE